MFLQMQRVACLTCPYRGGGNIESCFLLGFVQKLYRDNTIDIVKIYVSELGPLPLQEKSSPLRLKIGPMH